MYRKTKTASTFSLRVRTTTAKNTHFWVVSVFVTTSIRSCLLFSFQTLSYQSFKSNTTTTRYKVTVKETTYNRMQQKINTLSKANYKRYKHVFEDIHFFFFFTYSYNTIYTSFIDYSTRTRVHDIVYRYGLKYLIYWKMYYNTIALHFHSNHF